MTTDFVNSMNQSNQAYLCWLLDRGVVDSYEIPILKLDTDTSKPFYFLYEGDQLSILEQELLNKIISALPLKPAEFECFGVDSFLSKNISNINSTLLVFAQTEDRLISFSSKVILLPSLSAMIKKPELKRPAWQQLKQIFNF